jgi:hypothetical protein
MDVATVAMVIGGTTFLVVTTIVLVFYRVSSRREEEERADYYARTWNLASTGSAPGRSATHPR